MLMALPPLTDLLTDRLAALRLRAMHTSNDVAMALLGSPHGFIKAKRANCPSYGMASKPMGAYSLF